MPRETIEALSDPEREGRVLLRCPGPMRVRLERKRGERVVHGSRLGFAVVDERVFLLRSPAAGLITATHAGEHWSNREYGEPLAELSLSAAPSGEEIAPPAENASGFYRLLSPTHGTFYQRPSPQEPPYVEVGQRLVPGQTVGLVEVMKCFSPIRFEPPEPATGGIVREIVAQDGAEVRADQVLLRIELIEEP